MWIAHCSLGKFYRKVQDMAKTIDQADLIFGIIEVAKYLGITKKTVHVMIKEEIFPQPAILQNVGKRVIKVWKKSDLDKFKPNLRPAHRPKSVT